MRSFMTVLVAILLLAAGCTQTENKMKDSENPFFSEYDTPFQVPPFDLIEEEHFLPAFEKGIEVEKQEISDIVNNTDEPEF